MFVPLYDKAYRQIKELILAGELVQGGIYSEAKVAEMMGMSRTPLREALRRLQQEKIVDIIPSKGFVIHQLTMQDVIETFQVRGALEGYAIIQLARTHRTTEGKRLIERIASIIDRQEHILRTSRDVVEFADIDQDMHIAIVGYVKNSSFEELFSTHLYRFKTFAVQSFAYPGRLEDTVKEHRRILEGLRCGDAERAYSAVLQHMEGPVSIFSSLIESDCGSNRLSAPLNLMEK